MTRTQPVFIGVFAGLVVGLVAALGAVHVANANTRAALAATSAPPAESITGTPYGGDPDQEARLVESEAERLVYVRSLSAAARWNEAITDGPYRLRTGPSYTLVLPARPAPYTTADLTQLAPDTFVAQPGGAYLLSENVLVLTGATLDLSAPAGSATADNPAAGLDLRLESNEQFFSTIVTMGGSLSIKGTAEAPVSITSWNSDRGTVDERTDDGRSYVRVVGGHASISHASLANLGFWSGDTGGLALTGTDSAGTFDASATPGSAGEAEPVSGAQILPPGEIAEATVASEYSFVSAGLDHVTLAGNAFGLFVTGADGVIVRDSTISDSLVDGLVFHRYVTDSSVLRTVSQRNAVDGFAIARSSSNVRFTEVQAKDNGRNGMSLDGQPLAAGPSATGTPLESYGDNKVTDSSFVDNARYGIEISGGRNLVVSSSRVESNQSGVVVNHAAKQVEISDNHFEGQAVQSIAIRESVTDATVAGNDIEGGNTGIYVRNAAADVTGNSIGEVSNHGVTLVGDTRKTIVDDNAIAGFGSTPIYSEDAVGGALLDNETRQWRPAVTLDSVAGSFFQPLTMVWLALGLLALITAVTHGGRGNTRIRHPYEERVPLAAFSRGVVSRESLGGKL